MLSAMDIHNKEFKKGFRGYNEMEVDEFLDKVVKDYELLYRENLELKETVERVSGKLEYYQNLESTLQSTLLIAQETASEVRVHAKKEVDLKMQEAENNTQKMIEDATNKSRNMVEEATNKSNKMLEEATENSRKMIEDAENQARRMLRETNERIAKANEEFENMRKDTQIFKAKLKSMLESQLQIIENTEQDT